MQYHIEDYRPGDPDVKPELPGIGSKNKLPETTDVLIIGCGPAGLTLAAQMAAFPDIDTCIVEQKTGPIKRGHADGVACRTMEMFNAFGFAHKILRESCWVNETTFWRTHDDPSKGIYRSGRVQDTEDGLSEFPHVIVNQARVSNLFLDVMKNSSRRNEPFYRRKVISLSTEEGEYPTKVELEYENEIGEITRETVRAKYVVGTDGARSTVRKELALELKGDSANQAWGVMDILSITDFPDIRMKSIINAAGGGSVVLIPREGGFLTRIYVEMDKLGEDERVRTRTFDSQDVIDAANKVFHPYTIDVRNIAWWSVYEIGQRMTDRFDNLPIHAPEHHAPTIFIAGDACHTHSPKAGQGMNVSMQDTFNLGWKLAAVLRGMSPESLLKTYNEERHTIAKQLIDFDKEWAGMLHKASLNDGSVTAEQVQEYFVRSGRYTAGTATRYDRSLLTGDTEHQKLASGLTIGSRFHSSTVIRLADAKPIHLGHTIDADGRWRLFAFTPQNSIKASINALNSLCTFLEKDPNSPIVRYTPKEAEADSIFDVRAILPFHFRDLDLSDMPDFLFPRKGKFQLKDYEKIFCTGSEEVDFFQQRGIDTEKGCIVIVRPDQYISHVLPLGATSDLAQFFEPIMLDNKLTQARNS